MLKPSLFIPPVVALIVAGNWFGMQRKSISTLEQEIILLRRHISTATANIASGSQNQKARSPSKAKDKEAINWKNTAAQFAEMQRSGGMGDMRAMMRFQKRLMAMDAQEIVAALDEIAALDLPDEQQNILTQMLIGPLTSKDPELALTRFTDQLKDSDSPFRWQLSNAMGQWAKKDPVKASAWLDQQISAGTFDSKSLDGKNQSRMQFEGALIGVLLAGDPDSASRRLAALPEDQRADVLRHHTSNRLPEENQRAFAKLVREQLPEHEQAQVISQQASQLAQQGDNYEKASAYLDRIDATPAERKASAGAATSKLRNISHQRKLTREDVDTMREWISTQSPDDTDRLTGKALGQTLNGQGNNTLEAVSELAVQYHESSGNDEVLATFLESWQVRQNKEQARELAGKISDQERREKILKTLE